MKQVESDEKLIAAVLAGNACAFEQLVHRHYGLVYAIAYARLQSRELAEELAQDVFLRAFLLLERLNNPALFSHWLTRTTRNLSIDWQRKDLRGTRLSTFVPMDELPAELADFRTTDPRSRAISREQLEALSSALQQIDCPDRELVLLHYSEGLSHAEIAERLEVERSTVTKRLGRIVSSLRSAFRSNDLSPCTALASHRAAKTRTIASVLTLLAAPQETRSAMAERAQLDFASPQAPRIPRSSRTIVVTRFAFGAAHGFALWLLWYVKVTAGVVGALALICASAYLLYSNVQAEVLSADTALQAESPRTVAQVAQPAPDPRPVPQADESNAPAASPGSNKPTELLQQQFTDASAELGGDVGISVVHLESGRTVQLNADTSIPLYSVFKLPLAVDVLKHVEQGKLTLEQKVRITRSDRSINASTYNSDRWKKLPKTYTVRELLQFTLIDSDNTACDKLLQLVGGPAALTTHLQALGLAGIQVRIPTRDIGKYKEHPNLASASSIVQMLDKIYKCTVLRPAESKLLLDMMSNCATGPNRMRSMMPAGSVVMDKTGTGENGTAINDVGIITLPNNGGHLAIAFFIAGSKQTQKLQEQKIAELARAAYDTFTAR